VRLAVLPLVVHGVRLSHAAARARPHLQELAKRYRNRKDPASMRALLDERRRISAEHRVSRLGSLPLLVQLPIWIALYHLLAHVSAGVSVGAMSPHLVASFGAATLLGVPLAARGYAGAGWTHLVVVAALVGTAAALTYVTQRYLVVPNTVLDGLPDLSIRIQQLMPLLSTLGVLLAGGVVPVALLVYWVIWRGCPTPGSPAAARAARR
jgi:YidC/Oxa1 family membrane protein insertase